jgi:signal transduction histidine kinase
MAQAMRQIRGDGDETSAPTQTDASPTPAALAEAAAIEDRRATSPFVNELTVDARKSLTRILGITQILKHKKDGKEHAQLVRQLAMYTRRLDHVVADLADAERLVRGTVELTVRRTDLEPLVQRVAEESGVDADHDLRVETERVVVAIDQQRTEQIVAGLLRSAGDRTPPKKTITVRLSASEGGAQIAVEDPEPSSDASLSPVVQRFAEVQGGRATVESREDGGSSFKVFLPDGAGVEAPGGRGAASDQVAPDDEGALHIVVDGVQESASANGSVLVDELHRLSTTED